MKILILHLHPNAKTKEWDLRVYPIRFSVNQDATYGLSFVEKGQAKGKKIDIDN